MGPPRVNIEIPTVPACFGLDADKDELIVHDMDMDLVKKARDTWQFFRDRRPETYGPLVAQE